MPNKMILALMFVMLVVPALAQDETSPVTESSDLEAKLRFAGSQHEIIGLLLDEERYAEVLPEFRKILDLNLTSEDEKPVVQEAWLVGESMSEVGEYELAHQVVDETLDELDTSESMFYLLMLKGKIFQDEGLTEEVLEAYQEAQLYKDNSSGRARAE